MSIKTVLLVAASVLVATPELAMARSKSRSADPIVNHSSGPVSYAELQQLSQTGYNTRSSRSRRRQTTSSVAANTSTAGVDATSTAPAAPATSDVGAPATTGGATITPPSPDVQAGPSPALAPAPITPPATTPPQ